VLLALLAELPPDIKFMSLLGGLAADSDKPMPAAMRNYIIENWQAIEQQVPSTRFNYDFWDKCQPKRSTYPACRAVIAARKQDPTFDSRMTLAIQEAYYLQARNPSETKTLIELAEETGLNVDQFSYDLVSATTNTILLDEIKTARNLSLNSFPGLLLVENQTFLPIAPDYHTATTILEKILQMMG
jgi:putative protein-disulfide isomerase